MEMTVSTSTRNGSLSAARTSTLARPSTCMVALRFASSLRAFRALRRHQVNVFSLRDANSAATQHWPPCCPQQALQLSGQQTELPGRAAAPKASTSSTCPLMSQHQPLMVLSCHGVVAQLRSGSVATDTMWWEQAPCWGMGELRAGWVEPCYLTELTMEGGRVPDEGHGVPAAT